METAYESIELFLGKLQKKKKKPRKNLSKVMNDLICLTKESIDNFKYLKIQLNL